VYKLQNTGSRLKHESFPLEAAGYWAGMTLEEIHEENDVEDAGEDDHSPPTPNAQRRVPVGRLLGDMKEHQLQATVGA
jgi:hypothetical protein